MTLDRDPLMDAPMPTDWPTKAEIESFAAENRAAREAMLAAVDGRAVDFDCETAGVVPRPSSDLRRLVVRRRVSYFQNGNRAVVRLSRG